MRGLPFAVTRQLLRFPCSSAAPTKTDVLVSIRSFDVPTSGAIFKLAKQHGYTVTEVFYSIALVAAIEVIPTASSATAPNAFFETANPTSARRWITPEQRDDECNAITASSIYTPVAAMRKASVALAAGTLDDFFALCSTQRDYLQAQRTDSRELEIMPESVATLRQR